jgi:hypothetical protein
LSGRCLCDGLITRPEDSNRLWRVVVCDQETSNTRRLKPATGLWKYNHTGLYRQENKHDSIPLAYVKMLCIFYLTAFVSTGGFLIRHSNGHRKENTTPIKAVPRLFLTKHYSFNLKISKLQSNHDRNVSTGPLGTSRGSPWIRRAHFGNHCSILFIENNFRGADKSLARPTSRCILFDDKNISFDAHLVLYIYI